VVAGFITYGLAARTENALVADNYYKEGLAINQVLDAERRARDLGLTAQIRLDEKQVRVELKGLPQMPGRVRLQIVHPTHVRFDMSFDLSPDKGGSFERTLSEDEIGALHAAASRWWVRLEDGESTWRLTGDWSPARVSAIELVAKPR